MFIWDFVLGDIMDQVIDWVYAQLVGFFGNFFSQMGNMGVELFEMSWVQSIVLFFSYLAWALYAVGLVVAVFECGIEYQTGRASVKDTALGAIKGFMAVGCFTLVPVELYKLAVDLQAGLTNGLTGYGSIDALATGITDALSAGNVGSIDASGVFGGLTSVITSPIIALYVFHPPRIHGWVYTVVQANHRFVPDHLPAGNDSDRRPVGAERPRPAGTWPHALSRRGSKDLRSLWPGYLYPRQHYVGRLCSADSNQYHPYSNPNCSGQVVKCSLTIQKRRTV